MKIACVSDDGVRISPHFGRAEFYVIVTIEDGAIVAREVVEKYSPHRAGDLHHNDENQLDQHLHAERHHRMFGPILDCEVAIARGMGSSAYTHLREAGVRPILTDLQTIDEAVDAHLAGTLEHRPERLHQH